MDLNAPVTLSVLARRLNVSTTTVSKALHGKPGIGAAMVERVHALARELKYQPNFAAQQLKTNAVDAVGVLITGDIVNPWYSQLVSGLADKLFACGHTMVLALGKDDLEREREVLNGFSGGRVGGVIIGPIVRQRDFQPLWEAWDKGVPVVAFNCVEELPLSYVAIDQRAGARLAVEHLIAQGHRRLVYLGCPPVDMQESGATRSDGFVNAMFDHDLPLTKQSIIPGDNTRRCGYENMKVLLTLPADRRPTAIFCHNDNVALGAMLAVQQAGLKVPDDISLIGFDDIGESALSVPGLTTIGGVMQELSAGLVQVMRQLMEHRPITPIRQLITPKLIERMSVKSLN